MSRKKNGQEKGRDNAADLKAWIEERNRRRDWEEYAYGNRLNRSVVAKELDFGRSVTTQNPEVKRLFNEADALWFATDAIDKLAHDAARARAEDRSGRISSENGDLRQRVAELEAENRQLHRELAIYRRQQALIARGDSGFRL